MPHPPEPAEPVGAPTGSPSPDQLSRHEIEARHVERDRLLAQLPGWRKGTRLIKYQRCTILARRTTDLPPELIGQLIVAAPLVKEYQQDDDRQLLVVFPEEHELTELPKIIAWEHLVTETAIDQSIQQLAKQLGLNETQQGIMAQVHRGLPWKIGSAIEASESNVRSQLSQIAEKVGVDDQAGLVLWMLEHGLVKEHLIEPYPVAAKVLTTDELEMAGYFGLTDSEIREMRGLTLDEFKMHRRNIKRKMNCLGRLDLVLVLGVQRVLTWPETQAMRQQLKASDGSA